MDSYHKITEEPLTEEERKTLNQGIRFIPIFILICVVVFGIMFTMVDDEFFFWALVGMATLFILVIFFIVRGIMLDLKEGVKSVITGVITKKEHYYSKGSRDSQGKTYYYFHFGNYKLTVQFDLFNAYQENDLVEIKKSKRSNIYFDHKLIKSNTMNEDLFKEVQEEIKKNNPIAKVFFGIFMLLVVATIIFIVYLNMR